MLGPGSRDAPAEAAVTRCLARRARGEPGGEEVVSPSPTAAGGKLDPGGGREVGEGGLARRQRAGPSRVRLDSCGAGRRLPSREVTGGRGGRARAPRETVFVLEV